jgi:hypothetical protein
MRRRDGGRLLKISTRAKVKAKRVGRDGGAAGGGKPLTSRAALGAGRGRSPRQSADRRSVHQGRGRRGLPRGGAGARTERRMALSIGFIFMATRDDVTLRDARAYIEAALALGVVNLGFKDVGLPRSALRELAQAIRAGGGRSFLEVVSLDRDSELASAAAAADFGVDWLLGGVRADEVAPIARAAGLRYAPFPGEIVGHPSALAGSQDEIVDSARALAALDGVDGLDLLAYRSAVDPSDLIRAVTAAVDKPVIVAGSIDAPQRVRAVVAGGAAGFTIGTAAIVGDYAPGERDFAAQIRAVQRSVADLT